MITKPTLYTQELVDKICKLIETDDYSIKELCKNVGIAEQTFYLWKRENEDFVAQLKKADEKRLEFFKTEARKATLKKIQGYDYEETHTTLVDDGTKNPKIKEKKIVKKHVAPDSTLLMYTLNNTDPDNFAYKERHDITSGGEKISGFKIVIEDPTEEKTK